MLASTMADYSLRENKRLSKSLIMSFLSQNTALLCGVCGGQNYEARSGVCEGESGKWEWSAVCMIKLSARWHRPR